MGALVHCLRVTEIKWESGFVSCISMPGFCQAERALKERRRWRRPRSMKEHYGAKRESFSSVLEAVSRRSRLSFQRAWNWMPVPNPKGHSERPTNLCLSGALREARHGRH